MPCTKFIHSLTFYRIYIYDYQITPLKSETKPQKAFWQRFDSKPDSQLSDSDDDISGDFITNNKRFLALYHI